MRIDVTTLEGEEQVRTMVAAGKMVTIEGGWATVTDRPLREVPQSVTMRQAQRALLAVGKLDAVNAAIAAIPGDAGRAARIDWEKSSSVKRNWPLVASVGAALGMTDGEIDDLFRTAATL